jgi:hypothetical protein
MGHCATASLSPTKMPTGKEREREREEEEEEVSAHVSVFFFFFQFFFISKFWRMLTQKENLVEFTIEKKFKKIPNFFVF